MDFFLVKNLTGTVEDLYPSVIWFYVKQFTNFNLKQGTLYRWLGTAKTFFFLIIRIMTFIAFNIERMHSLYRLESRLYGTTNVHCNEWNDLGKCIWHHLQTLQGRMTSSPTWQRRENLGSRLSNALSNPVSIITSFHIYKVAKGIHKWLSCWLCNIKNKSQPITAVVSMNKTLHSQNKKTNVTDWKLWKVHVFPIPSKTNGQNYTAFLD